MADYTIPMSGNVQQISSQPLKPVDPNIPMAVEPFEPVDPIKQAQKVYTMAEKVGDVEDAQLKRETEAADRAALQALMRSGVNLSTVEGIDQALKDVPTLSPTAQKGLLATKQSIEQNTVKVQSHLAELDDRTLEQAHKVGEDALRRISPIVDTYDEDLKKGVPEAEATAKFNSGIQALVTMERNNIDPVTNKTRMTPQALDELSKASVDDIRHRVNEGEYKVKQFKDALDKKAKEAKIAKDEAAAERELALAEKALSPPPKTANLKPETIMYNGKRTLANYDPATGTYTSPGGTTLDADKIAPEPKVEAEGRMEMKTLKVDGEPAAVTFNSKDGKYRIGNEVIDPSRIAPIEKNQLSPVQVGTVEKDIFEAQKFLDKAKEMKTGTTVSAFFMDEKTPGFAQRWAEKKLTPKESQMYDLYANRVANAIVGMQSLGRYRGAVKTIDEARKLLPQLGEDPAVIKEKLKYIEDYTRDTDEELTKLKANRKLIMPPKDSEPAAPAAGPKVKRVGKYTTVDDVGKDLQAGVISQEEATTIWQQMGVK